MNDPRERQRRLIRVVLAIRLAAILCWALAIPPLAEAVGELAEKSGVRGALKDEEFAYTVRVLVALESITWKELATWLPDYGPATMAVGLGAYLWWRRPENILRRRGAPA